MKLLYLVCGLLLLLIMPILATVDKRNGISINTASTINGITPVAAINGQSVATPTPTATATVAGPTPVQQKTGTGTSSFDLAIVPDATIASGDYIVVAIAYVTTANSITGVQDDKGNTYTEYAPSNGTAIGVDFWTATNVDLGSVNQVVVTQASGTLRLTAIVSEWDSSISNSTAEATHTGTGTVSSTVSTGTITPASTHNLLIATAGWTADDYSSGPTNSFTRMSHDGGGVVYQESAYLYQTAATAKSTGYTLTAGINWAASVISLPCP